MSKTILNLNFQNKALQSLPIDPIKENYVRKVRDVFLSLVKPTPVQNPKLVHYSQEALELLDLDETEKIQFPAFFSGNQLLPGSEPYASVYCGHQFKIFVNQLGDGRAITLGEIQNNKGETWELQLKGAGKTPFSRAADGRAVLRSSIREFLCSEALYHLGIPTTRAATIVTSDTDVERDIEYNGNVIQEKATIVSRLAPTFIRFGSFQITDPMGPSPNNQELLIKLLDYVIYNHYSDYLPKFCSTIHMRVIPFANTLCLKTAETAALWEASGFTHGVLNTDNMSIIGLTMDFGPFGFMESYDPDFTPNTSDKEGRYSFKNQAGVCKWNLKQLFMSIGTLLSMNKELGEIAEKFCTLHQDAYMKKMRQKLGLVKIIPDDDKLVEALLKTMHLTGGDYTNIFRSLSQFNNNMSEQVDTIMKQCKEKKEIGKSLWATWLQLYKNRLSLETTTYQTRIRMMNSNNPKYILRNHMAQVAIEKAEKGDYSEVVRLFDLLKDPYATSEDKYQDMNYDKPAPKSSKISLSCSS